jgi:hypothetical protein
MSLCQVVFFLVEYTGMNFVKNSLFFLLFLVILMTTASGVTFGILKLVHKNDTAIAKYDLQKALDSLPKNIVSSTVQIISETVTNTPANNIATTTISTVEKKPVDTKTSTTTPIAKQTKKVLPIPFTSQAPFGDWADMRQEAGCEEASLLMVIHWITGNKLTADIVLKEILAMSAYETKNFGEYRDTSLADTLKLFNEYFGYNNASVKYDITVNDIKNAIDNNEAVIVPVNGQILDNPYFTPPGPPIHQLVIIGYDDASKEFITNEPGTRHGANFRYSYSNMLSAIGDYLTGFHESIAVRRKGMLVISQNQ